MGGGFEIALACDIIIASEGGCLRTAGAARGPGGTRGRPAPPAARDRLQAGAGHDPDRAAGDGAAEGKSLGFVNEVVAAGQLMETAKAWAKQILELSPMSVRASKQAVIRGLAEPSVQAAIENQRNYPAIAAMFRSEDFIEGPMAFAQKRPPQWKGKVENAQALLTETRVSVRCRKAPGARPSEQRHGSCCREQPEADCGSVLAIDPVREPECVGDHARARRTDGVSDHLHRRYRRRSDRAFGFRQMLKHCARDISPTRTEARAKYESLKQHQ